MTEITKGEAINKLKENKIVNGCRKIDGQQLRIFNLAVRPYDIKSLIDRDGRKFYFWIN